MKRLLKIITSFALAFSFSYYSNAQSDSLDLDLGRIKQKKEFTQTITIKGKDLEKFPFSNLTEAINTWFYGNLTNNSGFVFVIDGILITDVNAYSIYDIEEITLVQNALAQLNGVSREQHLILIKTRKSSVEGVQISAGSQFNFVNIKPEESLLGSEDRKSEVNYFHQHYFSVSKKTKSSKLGISASYLRDVFPVAKSDNLHRTVPYNINRIRLNGSIEKSITQNSSLQMNMNFVPQMIDLKEYEIGYGEEKFNDLNSTAKLFSTGVTLKSHDSKGLLNTLSLTYNSLKTHMYFSNENYRNSAYVKKNTFHNVLLMNNLSYDKRFGNWGITPSLNLTFRFKEGPYSYYRMFLFTPSANFYYKNSFNVQAGFLANLSNGDKNEMTRINPFISASMDIINLINEESDVSLKIFSSYAESDFLHDGVDKLENLNASYSTIKDVWIRLNLENLNGSYSTIRYFLNYFIDSPTDEESTGSNFQLGSGLSLLQNSISLNYNYENRNYSFPELRSTGFDSKIFYYDAHAHIHRLGISVDVVHQSPFSWLSGLSYARRKMKTEGYGVKNEDVVVKDKSWYGGWVNRFQYRGWGLGFDIIYKMKDDKLFYSLDPYRRKILEDTEKMNTIVLQNIYFGYRFNSVDLAGVELYINSHNLVGAINTTTADTKRYYGFGLKMGL